MCSYGPVYLSKFREGFLSEISNLSVCVLWVALDRWYYVSTKVQSHPASGITLKMLSNAASEMESPKARQPEKLVFRKA